MVEYSQHYGLKPEKRRKHMKKLLAILLSLLMIVSCISMLSACGRKGGNDEEKSSKKKDKIEEEDEEVSIVGKWEAEIDFAKVIGEELEDFDVDEMVVTLTAEFDKKGKVELSFDEDEIADAVLDVLKDMVESEYGMDFDDFLDESGMTEDDLVEAMFEDMDTSELHHEGVYKLDGDKLDMADDEDEFGENIYTIKLTEKKLVLEEVEYAHEDDLDDSFGDFEEMLPITFKRK